MKRFYIILAMISIMTVMVGCDGGSASDKVAVDKAEGNYQIYSGNSCKVADVTTSTESIYLKYNQVLINNHDCTMRGELVYGSSATSATKVADVITQFTYDVDTSSERTWSWNTTTTGTTLGHKYISGSQYKGYDVAVTWGTTTISPSSVAGATFMNDNKILPVYTGTGTPLYETWQNGNQIDVSGRYWSIDTGVALNYTGNAGRNQQVYPNGVKTYTVANIFDSSTTFAHADNFGDTVTGHAGIFIGITGTYNSYMSKVFVYTTADESTEAGRLIGCWTKFYK